jgi:hypothetical protein
LNGKEEISKAIGKRESNLRGDQPRLFALEVNKNYLSPFAAVGPAVKRSSKPSSPDSFINLLGIFLSNTTLWFESKEGEK